MANPQTSLVKRLRARMDFLRTISWDSGSIAKYLVILWALANFKNLLFVWHYRVFRSFTARLLNRPKRILDPVCLFLPSISSSHAPLLETDFNLHKSNSTYLSDVDVSRANLAVLLLGDQVQTMPWHDRPRLMLGGIQVVWRKEIKPYTEYEMWTRIVAWSEKWFYSVTYFVEKGRFKPELYLRDPNIEVKDLKTFLEDNKAKATEMREKHSRAIYASVVSRVVVKKGRAVIPPAELMDKAGLMPKDEETLKVVEEIRLKGLKLMEQGGSWDGLHATFFDATTELALGKYTDLFRRTK